MKPRRSNHENRDLAAAPEKKEHFGIIYAEALAGGTVPVAYEGGGVASIITKDVGVLTDRDPVALGDAIATANYHYPSLVDELVSWLQRR